MIEALIDRAHETTSSSFVPLKRLTARLPTRVVDAVLLVLFGLVVFGLVVVAVALAPRGSNVAAWWPAAGVSVAALIKRWDQRWWYAAAIFVFSGLGNLVAHRPLWISVGFGLSNTAEALVVGAIAVHLGITGLRQVGDIGRFVIATALGAAVISCGAAATVRIFGEGDLPALMTSVFTSHAASVMLIAPMALSGATRVRRARHEHLTLWLMSLGAVLFVFGPSHALPIAFVPTGFILWTAARLGVRATALQMVVIGVVMTVLTGAGGGPFAAARGVSQSVELSNSLVQLFIVTNAIVLLPIAIVVAERESARSRLETSEMVFRAGFSEAILAMALVEFEADGARVIEANDAARRAIGVTVGSLLDRRLRDTDGHSLHDLAPELIRGDGWRGTMLLDDASVRTFDVSMALIAGIRHGSVAAVQFVETTEQHRVTAALEHSARYDHLTAVPNRAAFEQCLDDLLDDAIAAGSVMSVMFVDVDDFKHVNDEWGHAAGDELLVQIARRLESAVRSDDVVGRVGGDEFLIALPAVGTSAVALARASRIQAAVQRPVTIGNESIVPSLSIGVALSRADSTRRVLLSEADMALYASKSAGKGMSTLYADELGLATTARRRVEAELAVAISERQFEMFLQPIVDMSTEAVVAAESLIRWNHPTEGLLAPAGWLEIAESGDLMPSIGRFVIDDSVRQAADWVSRWGVEAAPTVHVNISARQFEDHDLRGIVLAALDRHGLPPHKLLLELTETYLATVGPALIDELTGLRELGIQVAADDYGTGYSPLTRIVELPITMIKIDRQFVGTSTGDPRSSAIVAALLGLAKSLQIDVVAEGIEGIAQRDLLIDMGCRLGQGYLWSRPVPAADFVDLHEQSFSLRRVAP